MKEFFKELYENFPELEKSKENVEKTVYYLKDNKPLFAATSEFKTKLKTRLENITLLKSNKKTNFFIFAVPVFSFLFIVVGFTYYFKDISLLNDKTNITISNPINGIIEKNEVNENPILETFIEVGDNSDIDSSKNIKTNKKVEKIILDKYNTEVKKDEVEIVSTINLTNNEPITELNIVDNINESSIENDDIFNFLEALGENMDENQSFGSDVSNMGGSNLKMVGDSAPMMMGDSAEFSTFEIIEDFVGFEDFCKNNFGEIYEAGNEKICRIDKKECLSSNYVNGVCEFKEIK